MNLRLPTFASLLLASLVFTGVLAGQQLLRLDQDGDGYLGPGDFAVLASDEERDDLPCDVEALDPELEYDLNFRAGYNARIALRALAGRGNSLRVVFRITPLDTAQDPVYMQRRYRVPKIEAGAQGHANLSGKYRLGPGSYKVDWLMRDRTEKVCSSSWEIVAETVEGFEKLAATPRTSLVAPFDEEVFYEEPPVMRPRGELGHIKLIINFTPTNLAMAGLSAYDLKSVVSMARAIAREPEFGLFSVVAYQSQRELIFFEQNRATQIDFPALGEALADVRGGTVDIETLQDKESSRRFLLELLDQNLIHGESDPDAIIFLGPKLVFDRSVKMAVISPREITSSPIFYLIYNRNPRVYPWRDAISSGLSNQVIDEFNIAEAKDFGEALQAILARLETSETLTAVEQETTIP